MCVPSPHEQHPQRQVDGRRAGARNCSLATRHRRLKGVKITTRDRHECNCLLVSRSHVQTTRGGSQQTCHLRIIAPQVVKVEAEPRIAARQSALDGRQVSCLVNEVEECTLLLSNITHLGGRELCTREIEHPPSRNDPPRGLLYLRVSPQPQGQPRVAECFREESE